MQDAQVTKSLYRFIENGEICRTIIEPRHEISNNVVCATSKGSDQSAEYSMIIKLLTEHHLVFLSLKGGCTGWSESALVKIPHCWKLHVAAQLCLAAASVGSIRVNPEYSRPQRFFIPQPKNRCCGYNFKIKSSC